METISALLFILISVSLAGAAFALMWKNISDISKISNKIEVESRTVKRTVHPELLDVKPGDELMVVNFKETDERDPIYKSSLLYTSPSPRDRQKSRMPSSA